MEFKNCPLGVWGPYGILLPSNLFFSERMMSTNTTQENFTPEHEASTNKFLSALGVVLGIVFVAMGFLEVSSIVGHHLWFAYGIAAFATAFAFYLAITTKPRQP